MSCIDFKFHFSSDKAGTLDVHYAQHDKGKGEHKIVATKSNLEASSYGVRWNTHTIKLEDEPENFEASFTFSTFVLLQMSYQLIYLLKLYSFFQIGVRNIFQHISFYYWKKLFNIYNTSTIRNSYCHF